VISLEYSIFPPFKMMFGLFFTLIAFF